MRHYILAIGRLKNGAESDLINHYAKQLRPALTITELPDAPGNMASHARLAKEAAAILKTIPQNAHVIALDSRGENINSQVLAQHIAKAKQAAKPHCYWVIGGQDGLDDTVLKRANLVLAFSKLTWPHKLARVMLAEQIYRTESILNGHPYHLGH